MTRATDPSFDPSRRRLLFGRAAEAPRLASIGEGCLALAGVCCQSCGDACAERAIRFRPTLRGAPRPELRTEACTGCGDCVAACPSACIQVRPA